MKFNISTFLIPLFLLVSGISSAQDFLSENFNADAIPSGWAVDDQGAGACRWMVHASSSAVPMLGSNYLFVNSDSAGPATVGDETITSPLIPLNAGSQVFLSFQHFFRKRNGRQDTGRVEVFFNGNWIKALEFAANTGTASNPASELLNVSAWAGPEFRVRFQYKSLRAWYWAIDNIKVFTPPAADLGVAGIQNLSSPCGLAVPFPITVKIKNYGSQLQSGFPLSYQGAAQAAVTETFSDSILPGDSASYTFSTPFSTSVSGNLNVISWTSLAGDTNSINDSTTAQAFLAPGSFTLVDFTGFTGANLAQIHPGWAEATGLNAATGNSAWTSADVTQIQSFGSETIKVNLYTDFRREWVITPAFKAGADVNLKFKLALTDYLSPAAATMGSDDSLIVKISTNCGLSWQNLRVYTAADALTNQFVNQAVSLAAYAGQVVKIAFYAADGNVDDSNDYDIHLDDVRLRVLSPNDMEMAELIIPSGNCGVPATFPVKVRVVNSGSLSISSLPLSYQVQGQTIVSQNFSISLAPAADTILEFSTPVALSTQGNFFISAWGNLPGDANSIDDSVLAVPFSRAGESFPLQNFTGFNGSNLANGWAEASGFNASTAGAGWNPSASVQTTGLGSETAKINLYTNFKQDWIISPAIGLSTGKALRFKIALTNWNGMEIDSMGSDDSLAVKISTDCGQSWQMLKLYSSADNLSNQLITQTIPLTAYIGQTIRIGFYASEGTVDDASDYDMHIDDIELISLNPADVGVTSLILPSLDCGLPPSLPVKVNIGNLGTQPQTGFGISYSINSGTPVSETFSGTLAVGQEQVFQFATPADFSAAGSYVIKAWTSLSGDQDISNDTSTSAVLSTTPELLTGINFTGFDGTNLSTLFPGWSEKSGQIPSGSVSTWQASNGSQTTALGSATARVGLSGISKREWILSPGFKPAAQSEVRFRLAVTDRNFSVSDFMGSDDSLVVKITTDCGQNWTFLRAFTAQNNLSNVLTNYTADLSAFAGQTCQLGFFATDGNIDNLEDFEIHLDDLKTGPLTTEVQNLISMASAISLVPNPAIAQVSIRGLAENSALPRFFSASGKEFFPARISGSGFNFDISNLQSGYYLVRCGNSVAPLLVH